MNAIAIGQRIKQARENARLSQEALGNAVHCTTQHISAIERGVKVPRMDTFMNIANTLGASADFLLQDELVHSRTPFAEEIALLINGLSEYDQQRVLRAIRAFVLEK